MRQRAVLSSLQSRAEAVVALGFVGWVSESSSVWDAATDALLELSLKKDAAAQTAVAGEALCLVFSGTMRVRMCVVV